MKIRNLALLSLLAAALTACSVSIGTARVAEADLEKSVKDTLTQKAGQEPDAIDCPGDLTGKTGTTMRCTLTAGADNLGVTLTVTSVEGDTVNYDIEVDQS
ncbi:DUF4333 domain-containing protein [Nocardia pneumoniae]|uniref:DUF4333 domain-containing protein n=1 Tax=Nocardia pneumoniae TaxID=228601 RepID=UPI000315336B|nr:DUF4333 domain-containing protein [Nocardia pneumoniae]